MVRGDMTKITKSAMSRRALLAGGASASLTGCASLPLRTARPSPEPAPARDYALMYGPLPGEQFPIPAVDLARVNPRFYRRRVPYQSAERPGTIVVDTPNFYLYLVDENGTAMRYGVGLGRAGFEWAGRANIGWKQKWPKWTPPKEMIDRQPELEQWSAANGGMPPGLTNPLGSRALYIFQDGQDTLYRIHGTPEVHTIGRAVSSGCVRMINHDVIDLYDRVGSGTPILVRPGGAANV